MAPTRPTSPALHYLEGVGGDGVRLLLRDVQSRGARQGEAVVQVLPAHGFLQQPEGRRHLQSGTGAPLPPLPVGKAPCMLASGAGAGSPSLPGPDTPGCYQPPAKSMAGPCRAPCPILTLPAKPVPPGSFPGQDLPFPGFSLCSPFRWDEPRSPLTKGWCYIPGMLGQPASRAKLQAVQIPHRGTEHS